MKRILVIIKLRQAGLFQGSAEVLLVRQIVDQFASGLFARTLALLAVMPAFAQAELKQIGRKMACNEYFGASPE